MKRTNNDARGRGDWQGMNWCRQDLRLAIYLRDNLACAWCGMGIEQGATLTLDHLTPHSKGGDNSPCNLVTCCSHCNSSRGNRAMSAFAKVVADYRDHGMTQGEVLGRIRRLRNREIKEYRKTAKEMIADRGSCAKAVEAI